MTHRIAARAPREPVTAPRALTAPDEIATYLADASRFPGGASPRVLLPTTEGEVAWALRQRGPVLTVGAQSSLTGGGVPRGETLLATARMDAIVAVEGDHVRVQPGVAVVTLQEALAGRDLYFPPVPTFSGAFVGGMASTNAAGAATWKYGPMRDWVDGLTVVLAGGDVLDIRRGAVHASGAGRFEIERTDGRIVEVPVPTYAMPATPKCSAGYFAAPGMDLIDLFVGSEGTLGAIVEATLRVVPHPPRVLACLVPLPSEAAGIALTGELRAASRRTWETKDPAGIDVRAVEHLDRRSIELLREDGADRKHGVSFPEGSEIALIVEMEVARDVDEATATEALVAWDEPGGDATPIGRLLRLIAARDALDATVVALPGDRRRAEQIAAIREAVPMAVNHRVEKAQREVDPGIHKVAADMIVPFERFGEMMAIYREGFASRGLDFAIWGHISDGNVHPNVIPRALADVEKGKAAVLAFGADVARLGGCPLAEHGVGRNPVKQALLRGLYGDAGIEQMRAVRRALDPDGMLAPGVLFA